MSYKRLDPSTPFLSGTNHGGFLPPEKTTSAKTGPVGGRGLSMDTEELFRVSTPELHLTSFYRTPGTVKRFPKYRSEEGGIPVVVVGTPRTSPSGLPEDVRRVLTPFFCFSSVALSEGNNVDPFLSRHLRLWRTQNVNSFTKPLEEKTIKNKTYKSRNQPGSLRGTS